MTSRRLHSVCALMEEIPTIRYVLSLVSRKEHWGELKHRKTSPGVLLLESQLVKEDLGSLLAKMLSIFCAWHDTSQQHFLMSTTFIRLWSVLAWISSRCRRWLLRERSHLTSWIHLPYWPIPAHNLLSIDEVSKDNCTYTRLWGRAPIGQHMEQHDPFVWKQQYSMIAALALDEGIIAAWVAWRVIHNTFLEYLRNDVVCHFKLDLWFRHSHLISASPDNTISWPKKCIITWQC